MKYNSKAIHRPVMQHQAANAISGLPRNPRALDIIAVDINDGIPTYCVIGQVMEPLDGTEIDINEEKQMPTISEIMEAQAKDTYFVRTIKSC